MLRLSKRVDGFFETVRSGAVEIYNEFSLQHELGFCLREKLGERYKVQFERPFSLFGLAGDIEKKEIDISIFTSDHAEKYAVELKFPHAGQHPEQMFSACRDILFLEELVRAGFCGGMFVIAADDHLFYSGERCDGIYGAFRGDDVLTGDIHKPTGDRDVVLRLRGKHRILWHDVVDHLKYAVVVIDR